MSSPITAVQSTYLAGETTLCNNSCNVQPTSSDPPPPPRLELGPPQRRRVNPESLAARLGPELVAEMEKHIIPGSIEMPPFSVRRDIQVKFGIDRRHIYDFFHSRGLRCLNERAVRNNCFEGPQTKFPRPARNAAAPPSYPEPRKRRAAMAVLEVASSKRNYAPRKQKARQQRLERPLSPVGRDDICYAEGYSLIGPNSPGLPGLDVESLTLDVGQETLHSSDAPCLVSDVGSEPFSGQFSVFSSERAEAESDMPLCHSVSSLVDLVSSISTPTLSASSSMSSTVSSSSSDDPTEAQTKALPLTSQERQAHYAWLDGIIGPASGIQECVGSYKAFMEHQREVYYDRLCLMAEQPIRAAVSPATKEFKSCVGREYIQG
ncbi:hypothetical protein EDB92DRAFT_1429142 [Lactarius akahatsu]|uniref:Uncharacterized protein n=1 Tax=Lactarius akahatsu TaxID=416441 RepID=A0AAD4LNS6_9AGAM|nr:hypothetical protein EDB92DRAFT_1429142 [Lactarius akahatsu]